MQKLKHRIIIDTNLWISFLLTKDLIKIDSLLKGNHITLLFSEALIAEFISVAQRPKFKKYFTPNDLEDLLSKINSKAEFISITSNVFLCRDEKDNFLLDLAKDGKASHLITGDKDLLILQKVGKTKILTISDYFKIV